MSAWGQDASLLSHSSYGATVGWQSLAVLVTLTAASIGGTLAGAIVSSINPAKQSLGPHQLFDDGAFWTVRRLRPRTYLHKPVLSAFRNCASATNCNQWIGLLSMHGP